MQPARQELGPWEPVLTFLGGDVAAVLPLTDVGLNGAIAGRELYDSLKPLLTWQQNLGVSGGAEGSGGGGPQKNLGDIVVLLRQAQPGLRAAREHIDTALAAYHRIEGMSLSGEMGQMAAKLSNHASELNELDDAAGVLIDSPDLLASLIGESGQKTYLVLAQNNDELRPVGGFISTFGLLVVQDGQLIAHEFGPTTNSPLLTPPQQPCPSASPPWWIQLQKPAWGCWDAQWTADFPTMAQEAKWFYEHGNNPHSPVDGVIALDQTGMELLLDGLGSVTVPDYSEVITGSNLRDRVYYYRLKGAQSGESSLHKEFLSSLFGAVVDQDLAHLSAHQVNALMGALKDAVGGKHLLFYFTDPDLQALTVRLGADGSIRQAGGGGDYVGDYLYVVDTSMEEKVSYSINEQIAYYGQINTDDSVTGEATVSWAYPTEAVTADPAIANMVRLGKQTPWLVDLTRVYLPGGSKWLSMESNYPAYFGGEAGKLLVGTRAEVHAGESKQVLYRYQVPSCVQHEGDTSVYQLFVQKQPGTRDFPLRVRIALPPGRVLLSTTPGAKAGAVGGIMAVEFDTTLAADQTFRVTFR